jgi:hypothetical protein
LLHDYLFVSSYDSQGLRWRYSNSLPHECSLLQVKVNAKVTLRLTVSQSVCLSVELTLGFVTSYYFLSESCCPVSMGRPLRRGDGFAVCSAITQWSDSRIIGNHTLLSLLRLYPNLEGKAPVFIPPRNRVAQLYPWALGSHLRRLLRLAGLRWRYSNPPPRFVSSLFNSRRAK